MRARSFLHLVASRPLWPALGGVVVIMVIAPEHPGTEKKPSA